MLALNYNLALWFRCRTSLNCTLPVRTSSATKPVSKSRQPLEMQSDLCRPDIANPYRNCPAYLLSSATAASNGQPPYTCTFGENNPVFFANPIRKIIAKEEPRRLLSLSKGIKPIIRPNPGRRKSMFLFKPHIVRSQSIGWRTRFY